MRFQKTALMLCALVASTAGCSEKTPGGVEQGTVAGKVGQVDLNLRLPSGTQLNTLSYTISNPNGYSKEGSVPLANSTVIRFQIGNIPAATGYSIAVAATTSAGEACTSQPATFGVQAHETSLVMLSLRCGGGTVGSTSGNVRVDVDVTDNPTCPDVDGLTAVPLEVIVGSTVSLTGYGTTSSATFGWAVDPIAAGSFSPASGANTTFTCSQVGSATITLTVSGPTGCSASTATVPVTCSPNGASGAGGTGGAGSGGTGGTGGTEAGTGGTEAGTGGTEAGTGGTTAGTGGTEAGTGGTEAGTGGTTAGTGGTEAGTGGTEAGTGGTTAGTGGTEAGTGGTTAGTGGTEAGTGGTEAGTGGTTAGTGGTPGLTCADCRNANCRDILGVDMVAGCFEAINTSFGASETDPTFLQNCMDVVNCARANHCAYDPTRETAECYCGTGRDNVQCQSLGPVLAGQIDPATGVAYTADKLGKCTAEWQRATRTVINSEVLGLFGELSLPSGFADFLLKCDASKCNSAATGDCTVVGP